MQQQSRISSPLTSFSSRLSSTLTGSDPCMSVRRSSASRPACTGPRRRAEPLCAEAFPSSPPPSAISDLSPSGATHHPNQPTPPGVAPRRRRAPVPPLCGVACCLRNARSAGGNPSGGVSLLGGERVAPPLAVCLVLLTTVCSKTGERKGE
jgi:hypothetical protein